MLETQSQPVLPAAAPSVQPMNAADLQNALRRAFNLGQTYWQQADSEYTSQHRKADVTRAKFEELVTAIIASIVSPTRGAAAPAEGVKTPVEFVPTHEQMMAGYEVACRFGIYGRRAFELAEQVWQAMLSASPSEGSAGDAPAPTILREVELLRQGAARLRAWHAKYGEHQPQWLPPAGDVRWLEDVDAATAASAKAIRAALTGLPRVAGDAPAAAPVQMSGQGKEAPQPVAQPVQQPTKGVLK